MKSYSSLIGLLLLFVSSGAFAQQGGTCEVGTERLRAIESALFMEACLARTAAPANVLEESLKHKSALCAQNAKNKSLHGNDISRYQQTCMNKNDAADVYSKFPA
jgi:hypothetical protein